MNTWKHPILPHNGSSAFAAKGSLCRGGGTPRARPAAEVSTFCSCLSPFSPRERSEWQWVPLVLLPACPLQQRASLCPAGTSCGAVVGLDNVRRAGMGWHSLACAGEEMGNSLHVFSLCFQLAVEWGAQGDKGTEAVLCALQWSSSQPVLELSQLGERLSPPLCFPAQGCVPIAGKRRNC